MIWGSFPSLILLTCAHQFVKTLERLRCCKMRVEESREVVKLYRGLNPLQQMLLLCYFTPFRSKLHKFSFRARSNE